MAITRLQRRQKRNRLNAIKQQAIIKGLLFRPVIKNIDVDALKAEFNKNSTANKKEAVAEKKATKTTKVKVKKEN